MAYTAIYANGSTFNMVKKFVIDSFNEIYDIDTSQLSPGSTAFDISSSKTYMLNNKKQWIEVQVGTGNYVTIATNDDAMDLLAEMGMTTPVTNSNGEILTSSSNDIYSL